MKILTLITLILLPSTLLAFDFTLLHTNDLHSYGEGSGPDSFFTAEPGDGDPVQGHYARLGALIKKIKKQNEEAKIPTLLVDAGDFYAGALFSLLGPSQATPALPELEFFHHLGYDAIILGNHDFDAGEEGLARMWEKARNQGMKLPLVVSNFKGQGPSFSRPYLIREITQDQKTLRVGILGALGPDGAFVSQGNRAAYQFEGFNDHNSKKDFPALVQHLQKKIDDLRSREKVNVVILVVHAGLPEDEDLAKALKGVQVIVSGHTHQRDERPRVVNKVLISQAGAHGEYLGHLRLKYRQEDSTVQWVKDQPSTLPIGDDLPADPFLLSRISFYKQEISRLAQGTGLLPYETPLWTFEHPLIRKKEPFNELGVFVTTRLERSLNRHRHQLNQPRPIDFYFTSLALIRKDIHLVDHRPTLYQFSDIFKMLGSGYEDEKISPSSVVTFYLSKKDVWSMINFLEFYSDISIHFTSAFSSSIKYEIRSWGIPFVNKLKNLTLKGRPYEEWPELIHVGTNSFAAAYFNKVKTLSYGILEFVPRDESGRPLKVFPPVQEDSALKEYLLFSRDLLEQP